MKKKRAKKYEEKIRIGGTLDDVLKILVKNPQPKKKRETKHKQEKPPKPKH